MDRISYLLLAITVLFLSACRNAGSNSTAGDSDSTFRYAKHIRMEHHDHYTVVTLADPWKSGRTLHTYILVNHADSARMEGRLPKGTTVYIPLRRAAVFTAAHANLIEMLHSGGAIAAVADAEYMHIPDIQRRLSHGSGSLKDDGIVDVGNSMRPDVEKIIGLRADAVFLSPFENSGGYGKLENINIPIIECADYMEDGALGRAEWMKFYGMLFGRESEADSLFRVVEENYLKLKEEAAHAKRSLSLLPDRKTGSVWYVPGGQSSVGLLYKDAGGRYAFSGDSHTGSLALPFETVLSKMGNADIWIMSYNGNMDRNNLMAEYPGYGVLKPFKTGNIYGCPVDKVPYFEEVSWRPDWLLGDLIQLLHPDLNKGKLRYYRKI